MSLHCESDEMNEKTMQTVPQLSVSSHTLTSHAKRTNRIDA